MNCYSLSSSTSRTRESCCVYIPNLFPSAATRITRAGFFAILEVNATADSCSGRADDRSNPCGRDSWQLTTTRCLTLSAGAGCTGKQVNAKMKGEPK